jgi:hypothetical protein
MRPRNLQRNCKNKVAAGEIKIALDFRDSPDLGAARRAQVPQLRHFNDEKTGLLSVKLLTAHGHACLNRAN